jgi:hypothetical protein
MPPRAAADPSDTTIRRLSAELPRMTEERDQALSRLAYARNRSNRCGRSC